MHLHGRSVSLNNSIFVRSIPFNTYLFGRYLCLSLLYYQVYLYDAYLKHKGLTRVVFLRYTL